MFSVVIRFGAEAVSDTNSAPVDLASVLVVYFELVNVQVSSLVDHWLTQ